MKKRILITSMLTFAFASLFVLSSCTNQTKQEEAREDIREDVVEIRQDLNEEMRDFKNYSYAEREKFVADANEELDDINENIEEMKAELDRAGDNISAETRVAYQKGIVDLEQIGRAHV